MRRILFFVVLIIPGIVFAHPGRTASDGCHYCRTNCSSWGEVSGARHCHGGYSAPTPSYRSNNTTSNCPNNSHYSTTVSGCVCNTGYARYQSANICVKVPSNAHVADTNTDAWLCDDGYSEINGECVTACENENFSVTVSEVIDGDTFAFDCAGKREKVRIIGIDTPETVHPTKAVECFGNEYLSYEYWSRKP